MLAEIHHLSWNLRSIQKSIRIHLPFELAEFKNTNVKYNLNQSSIWVSMNAHFAYTIIYEMPFIINKSAKNILRFLMHLDVVLFNHKSISVLV